MVYLVNIMGFFCELDVGDINISKFLGFGFGGVSEENR